MPLVGAWVQIRRIILALLQLEGQFARGHQRSAMSIRRDAPHHLRLLPRDRRFHLVALQVGRRSSILSEPPHPDTFPILRAALHEGFDPSGHFQLRQYDRTQAQAQR